MKMLAVKGGVIKEINTSSGDAQFVCEEPFDVLVARRIGGITISRALGNCIVTGAPVMDTDAFALIENKSGLPNVISREGIDRLGSMINLVEFPFPCDDCGVSGKPIGMVGDGKRFCQQCLQNHGPSLSVSDDSCCITHGQMTEKRESHAGCGVLVDNKVCECKCGDCVHAWESDGRPRVSRMGTVSRG